MSSSIYVNLENKMNSGSIDNGTVYTKFTQSLDLLEAPLERESERFNTEYIYEKKKYYLSANPWPHISITVHSNNL